LISQKSNFILLWPNHPHLIHIRGGERGGREGLSAPLHLPKVSLIPCKKFRMCWLPPFNHSSGATDTILSHPLIRHQGQSANDSLGAVLTFFLSQFQFRPAFRSDEERKTMNRCPFIISPKRNV
jgi:hypothetical protein